MKNADTPAMPTGETFNGTEATYGLTKREYFAGLITQAIISSGRMRGGIGDVTKEAVDGADILLQELDK